MADFSNLTYKQKNILLREIKNSIYEHKHTSDEIEKLKIIINNKENLPFDDYNPFDRNISEVLLKRFKEFQTNNKLKLKTI